MGIRIRVNKHLEVAFVGSILHSGAEDFQAWLGGSSRSFVVLVP